MFGVTNSSLRKNSRTMLTCHTLITRAIKLHFITIQTMLRPRILISSGLMIQVFLLEWERLRLVFINHSLFSRISLSAVPSLKIPSP